MATRLWSIGMAISTLFPVIASVAQPAVVPRWIGAADVVLAGALAVGGFLLMRRRASAAPVPQAMSRVLLQLPLVLLFLYFVAGSSIDWSILLPGLAWRLWLLGTVAPRLRTPGESRREL